MSRSYRINEPSVVAEIIDGEAIIMNLATGHYFSTRDCGCDLWHAVQAGVPLDDAFALVASRYGTTPDRVADESAAFVASLLGHRLIVEYAGAGRAHTAAADIDVSPQRADAPFVAPQLHVYTDMEELLLLDPIHDVDVAGGWPVPKAPEPNA